MSTIRKLNELSFVEDKNARDQYIVKTEVLNKVKLLTLLPDGEFLTTKMVKEYYGVDEVTIRQVVSRNRDELNIDGIKTLQGVEMKEYIKKIALHGVTLSAKANLLVFNRRCVLRIGMLLRDSEVAKQVRTYLLNIEETASKEHKVKASEHTGTWNTKEELILLDSVYNIVGNGGKLKDAIELASSKMDHSPAACQTRYNGKLKLIISDGKMLESIKNNRGNKKFKIVDASEMNMIIDSEKVIKSESSNEILSKLEDIDINMLNFFESHNNRLNKLMDENEKLKQDKNELFLLLNKTQYEGKLNETIYKDNLKEIKIISDAKDAEIKKMKNYAIDYKAKLTQVQEFLTPKPKEKGKSKPAIQQVTERSGKPFKIVDGATVFQD